MVHFAEGGLLRGSGEKRAPTIPWDANGRRNLPDSIAKLANDLGHDHVKDDVPVGIPGPRSIVCGHDAAESFFMILEAADSMLFSAI